MSWPPENHTREVLDAFISAMQKCIGAAEAAAGRGDAAHAREELHAYKSLCSLETEIRAILIDE